jgi:peptidoglycan/LPS O-acetylase OafA/YrhL
MVASSARFEIMISRPAAAPGGDVVVTERGHMSQLDGLRFFAVMGVLVTHYWRPHPDLWIARLPWGELGVRLFFVLSGFLITGILIGCRELGERNPERRLFLTRQFYMRRFLRIFPVYYTVLIALVAMDAGAARTMWPWLFTYTTNIHIWLHLAWPEKVGHFWSLAVEEQFYLVWPWLMLFLGRKWLVPLLIGLVCLAPVYRLYASFHYATDIARGGFTSGTLTIAVLDSLALGALLALASRSHPERERVQQLLRRLVLPVGALSYVLLLALAHYKINSHALVTFGQTAEALVFCWLIGAASRGFGGNMGRLLEWRPIAYLGKISYGIYIFHYFVPAGLVAAAGWAGFEYREPGLVNFVLASLVTFAVAALSWELFEARVNGLKRYFTYGRESDTRPLTSSAPAAEARPAAGIGVMP